MTTVCSTLREHTDLRRHLSFDTTKRCKCHRMYKNLQHNSNGHCIWCYSCTRMNHCLDWFHWEEVVCRYIITNGWQRNLFWFQRTVISSTETQYSHNCCSNGLRRRYEEAYEWSSRLRELEVFSFEGQEGCSECTSLANSCCFPAAHGHFLDNRSVASSVVALKGDGGVGHIVQSMKCFLQTNYFLM